MHYPAGRYSASMFIAKLELNRVFLMDCFVSHCLILDKIWSASYVTVAILTEFLGCLCNTQRNASRVLLRLLLLLIDHLFEVLPIDQPRSGIIVNYHPKRFCPSSNLESPEVREKTRSLKKNQS